jgi:hypothetical protein
MEYYATSESTIVKIKALVDPDLTVQVKVGEDGSQSGIENPG